MSWTTTIFKWLGYARYNSGGPSAPSNGETVELQCNSSGHLKVEVAAQTAEAAAPTTSWTTGTTEAAVGVVRASAGKLYGAVITNDGASDRFIFFFDDPNSADGTQLFKMKVKAGESIYLNLPRPRSASTGIYWAVSSTITTYTADGAAKFHVMAEHGAA